MGIFDKPRVFVSYHHGNDQHSYNEFNRLFSETYDLVTDRSLDEPVKSENADYVERQIREKHISGTSCTIVLIGTATHKRKFVDWEIYGTLYKEHGLLGIWLPEIYATLPARFNDNLITRYAYLINWTTNPGALRAAIEEARNKPARLIDNSRLKMSRNVP